MNCGSDAWVRRRPNGTIASHLSEEREQRAKMSNQPTVHQPVQFTIVRQQGQISSCTTSSALVNHFLDVVKATRAYNTWVSYTYDLKTFFAVIPKPPEAVD